METKMNTGAIFKNENKKAENHPDYKGKVNVNGKEMEVALWLKTSAKGLKFFSASFSEPYIKSEPHIQNNEPQIKEYGDANDDLPF
jgi:uncharacterized protein (DUF736 family)